MKTADEKISRRSFLGTGVASVVGAGLGIAGAAHGQPTQEEPAAKTGGEKPQIRGYRDLGGTGYKVSDLGFGNAYMQDPAILEYAMERGINYVDTARQYFDMEVVIGKLFPRKRDKLFVTTKLLPELVTADVSAAKLMEGIEDSLQRLNTDYIDACLIHSAGDPNLGDEKRIQNPNVAEAFQKAKQQGKIRIWGASAHGPKMIEDFTWLLDNTDIGMIMPGMNLLTKGLEPVLTKARQKGVAVVAMKSLSMGRKIDYSEYMTEGRTARQALIKWMLAQPNIDTISITMRTIEDIDELVAVSGNPAMTPKEKETLQGYRLRLEHDYCRPGCDGCLGTCPHDVPIHDILRYRMYFNNYGLEKYAMGLYASLPRSKQADRCAGCTGPCERSCPYQLAIRSKLLRAHAELTV